MALLQVYMGSWWPRPQALSLTLVGGGARRESLVHIICACANYLGYHTCMCYPRKYTEVSIMGMYKNTERHKNVLENLRICRASWAEPD